MHKHMDSEIAQTSRSSRLNIPVKLSRGSKKKGLTSASGLYRLGGRTIPENDKSETDKESKSDKEDEDDNEDENEDDNEGERSRPDKNKDRSTTAVRANKYRKPESVRDFSNPPSITQATDSSSTLKPEQSKPETESAKPSAPPLKVGKTRITISDDLSTDDNKKSRRLLALKAKSPKPASTSNLDISDNQLESYNPGEIGPGGPGGLQETHRIQTNHALQANHALQDYQMQLMLLEQQNKKRLMMARQEQANEVFGGSENHGLVTYGSKILQANGHDSLNHSDQMKRGPAHMDNLGMTSLPLPEGQIICSESGSDSGDFNYDSYGYPDDSIMNSPYLNKMSPNNIDISGIRHSSSYPVAASNQMTPQQMTMIQQQNALQNQQQMAMNRPQTFSPTQNEPLSPRVDSVIDLFSALGIDAITMGVPSESLNNVQAFREYLLQVIQAKKPNRYLILHRIKGKKDQIYFDPPEWVVGQSHTRILKSRLPLSNLTDYLDKHTDISFIVFRDYEENDMPTSKEMTAAAVDKDTGITKSPVHKEEKILAVSEELTEAIKSILKFKPNFSDLLTLIEKDGAELPSPFVFIYHSRAVIKRLMEDTSDPSAVRQLKLMIDYIYKNYGKEYDTADTMFDESRVAMPYVKYLFKPGDVLVKGTGADLNGYVLETWPLKVTSITAGLKEDGEKKPRSQYTMEVRSWSFDGAFKRVSTRLTLEIDGSEKTEYAIGDLNVRPITYASDEDRKTLQSRGEMFWKCRERHFVSYQEHGRGDLHGASEERYMIDMKTLRELHPEDEKKKKAPYPEDGKKKASNTLDEDAMAQDGPPDPSFVYLLPQKITGYNMRRKEWVELHADWLSEVIWDKKAFKKLVLARKTKDLVEALIVNQIAAEKSTDLISGKGNGLILLLHGGPGTGKTLTAESVAEIAERPLYRVTCGDIGSEPEEVEQYLYSVLDLGKAWGCVVLLDEADVFLEERSMSDIKINALVSIFLRVLEYHDGIIILTSNSVGTFDEAFKSRIQLALHYP